MENFDLLHEHLWRPFAFFNITHPFFSIDATVTLFSWVVLALLVILSVVVHFALRQKNGMLRYLIIQGVGSFVDLSIETLSNFQAHHFYFITALFLFIAFCNCISVLPWTEEPTSNLNTTLALALISFFYIQYYTIKVHGFSGYLKEFITPLFVMFPLHIIGKLSSIISLSFRLFGNIFGGAIISKLYFTAISGTLIYETLGLFSGFNFVIILFFGLFEGMLQAFVFSTLTLTYLSIAISSEDAVGDMP